MAVQFFHTSHLPFSSNVQRLSLKNCNLSTLSVRHLSDALCNIAITSNVQRLDLSNNSEVSEIQSINLHVCVLSEAVQHKAAITSYTCVNWLQFCVFFNVGKFTV